MNRNWLIAAAVVAALPAYGQNQEQAQAEAGGLTEVVVTAQRREENLRRVPLSVSTVDEDRLAAMIEGGEDIRALATRVPSLYAESSNGRLAPRFYIRGLGNSDFDLAASQPVSIIVDEVVLENVILKSFPLFDIERVEVLRGPQGTLFGRNTPAGIVKFDTKKPTEEFDANVALSYGELGTLNFQGAVGGGTEAVAGRVAVLYQERDDWIDNLGDPATAADDVSDAIGGYDELAYRAQLLLTPSETFRALFNIHGRDIDGTASIFRANVLGPGDDFNGNFDRDTVFYDGGEGNNQGAESLGGSVRLDFDLANGMKLTSVSAYESTESFSRGDIDGGFGADFLGNSAPCVPGRSPCIPFPSDTQDAIDDLDQITQEIRLSQQATDQTFWQAGVFYFDSEFSVTTNPFFVPPTTVVHENTAYAAFGHVSYDVSDTLTVTGGVRFTDDEKDLSAFNNPGAPVPPTNVSDSKLSWDLSALFEVSESTNVYARLANGFRAPTIQGRDIAFFGQPSVADSETINSIEAGFKSLLSDNRVRLNGSVFYYQIEDQQLSAIGGGANFVRLINADKGTGIGFDLEGEFLMSDRLLVTAGLSYADTELDDSALRVPPCGGGQCTVLDPVDANGAIIDGNPFTQAPEYIATITARYVVPVGGGEVFFFTDWAFQGETTFFLYESAEYRSEGTFEGGLRIGYAPDDGKWEVALFGRNITDEENVKGGIDFNNLTGFDNEPRILGISFRANFN
jgi:iron complex outermembrane receptor protein